MSQDLWKNKEQPQRTLAPLSVPGASSAGSIRVVSGSGFRYVVPFPYRLHEMLSSVDEKHDSSIVSWLPDGKHFKVHDPRRFVETVIPSAFKQKSLKSFQRQLHLYGFQRVHEGVDKGELGTKSPYVELVISILPLVGRIGTTILTWLFSFLVRYSRCLLP